LLGRQLHLPGRFLRLADWLLKAAAASVTLRGIVTTFAAWLANDDLHGPQHHRFDFVGFLAGPMAIVAQAIDVVGCLN
jgi:hypothetical protein